MKTKGKSMTEKNDGGPAFPLHERDDALKGMSLRDWFAGQALAGLYADSRVNSSAEKAAEAVYKMADAMLKARESV